MFFKRKRDKEEKTVAESSLAKEFLVWLEIGVTNIEKVRPFYENVFNIAIDVKSFSGHLVGTFYKENRCLNVALLEKRHQQHHDNLVKPTFRVDVISEAILRVEENGGKVIAPPELLRQTNDKGETLIGANLIDNQLGYMAEIVDPEGNLILLYSHY